MLTHACFGACFSVTVFDLVNHGCWTLPYEHTSGIRAIAVSPDSRFLLSVDEVREDTHRHTKGNPSSTPKVLKCMEE